MFGFCSQFRYIPRILKEASIISYSRQCYLRRVHSSAISNSKESPESKIPTTRSERFEIFKDEPPSPMIIDVEGEREAVEKRFKPSKEEEEEEDYDVFYGISPQSMIIQHGFLNFFYFTIDYFFRRDHRSYRNTRSS